MIESISLVRRSTKTRSATARCVLLEASASRRLGVYELGLASRRLYMSLPPALSERIRQLDGRYHERAYLFVLAALEYQQRKSGVRGHISGQDLAWACRDFALEQFGLTARTVLGHWGIESTGDIGRIVFVLIDVGLLIRQPTDRIEDFDQIYDFSQAFDGSYPWSGIRGEETAG